VAQALVIAPHLFHLPPWIVGLWLGCALWRIQQFRMKVRAPTRIEKAGLLIVAAASVWFAQGTVIGLDGGTALLISMFVLKLVEMNTRRDALVVIFLGFFAVVIAYLFDDSFLAALYSLLPISALLAALIGLQQSGMANRPWPTYRLAGSLVLQALPLMLVLFLFFPRLGPLWSMPQSADKAVTGLSDTIAPGEIAELSQSAERAFRVSFEEDSPPRNTLYWRAATFERFDGQRWSVSQETAYSTAPQWQPAGPAVNYTVVMEPSQKPWLFALDVPQINQGDARLAADFHLQRRRPVDSPLMYKATSWPQVVREVQISPANSRRALQLPAGNDLQARAWIKDLQQRYPEPQALAGALLRYFRDEPFIYTLKPPVGGANAIDAFLFEHRRGFCAHYAGAMTFLLRVAGIPARMVAGYQGGEYNQAGNYLTVHQFDAHAWVEYWVAGKGWISVDPTAQVAPERIERGLEDALASARGEGAFLESSPFSPMRYRQFAWLNDVRMTWDRLNYGWQRWVLNYQAETQGDLLRSWFGKVDSATFVAALVGGGSLLVAMLALWLLKPWQRERDPQKKLFSQFERLVRRYGLEREKAETVRHFMHRTSQRLPDQQKEIEAFCLSFERQRYSREDVDESLLKERLRALKRALNTPGKADRV
jgi:transglutaminase-like putative cysteine protease